MCRFQQVVQGWLQEGLVQQWTAPVGRLRQGKFTPFTDGTSGVDTARYIASKGMRSIAEHIASQVSHVHHPTVAVPFTYIAVYYAHYQ